MLNTLRHLLVSQHTASSDWRVKSRSAGIVALVEWPTYGEWQRLSKIMGSKSCPSLAIFRSGASSSWRRSCLPAEQVRETSFGDVGGADPAQDSRRRNGPRASGELTLESVKTFATLVTSIFLHGDVEHILWNMVFLWTFGILTSDLLGQWRALAVFLDLRHLRRDSAHVC